MSEEFIAFLNAHASAAFGLLGALGGGLMAFFTAAWLRQKDYKLRAWERILERRLSAHESVLRFARDLRLMNGDAEVGSNNEIRRYPRILSSVEELHSWLTAFATEAVVATTWLNTSTKRELNFVQDYFVTLQLHAAQVPSQSFPQVGEIVRQDFVNMSSSLEKAAFTYFERDIHRLRLASLAEHHKYELKVTMQRLNETALVQNQSRIRALVRVSDQPAN